MSKSGRVELVRGEICIVNDIDGIGLGNVVAFSSGAKGLVMGFNESSADIAMLGNSIQVKKGDLVKVIAPRLTVAVGDQLLGRVINPLGLPLDGKGTIAMHDLPEFPIEAEARPVYQRALINRPFQSGYLAIDSQIPLGLGQRELLLGERQSGQNDIAVDIICNQARMHTGLVCIYVAIDSEAAATKRRLERMQQQGALQRTVAIVGRSSEAASLNYIAPMAGTTVAEYFAAKGLDVLIVYDDLTRHAKVYRQISLLLERPASREAYPGDVFYLHSRLLERSGSFNQLAGGGTITALPIVETQSEEATDYITTNLMSITDGHVLFRRTLANQGSQPPIDSGFSVSRIGGQAQFPLSRKLAEQVKGILIRYEEIARFMSFGTELSKDSLAAYEKGKFARLVFQQPHDTFYNAAEQAALMFLVISGQIQAWSESQIPEILSQFTAFLRRAPYKDIITPSSLLISNYERAKTILEKCLTDFLKSPGTTLPAEKKPQLVAEIESVSKLLQDSEEQVLDEKH